MLPVVTVAEMQAIDADASEPEDVLVGRAGRAVARSALAMLGGGYGRRIVVLAGPGNNGADGRVAAEQLRRRGAGVSVIDATAAPDRLPPCDLVIDAAFGTGISRDHISPDPGAAQVLAVDIASGIAGDTGVAMGRPMRADRTVTFAAHKPGLLLGAGPEHSGEVEVVDIGLDASRATVHLLDDASAAGLLPDRRRGAHKWHQAVRVVAGSPGMIGAAEMAAAAAQRAGAGMVQLAAPGVQRSIGPVESVSLHVEETGWCDALLEGIDRVGAVAIGPGLGTSMATRHQIRRFVEQVSAPLVVDGDALTAVGDDVAELLHGRLDATVLTPHDGEFARLAGHAPGDDRIGDARELAARSGAVVLLKGPTTVVAAPGGAVRLVTAGDERLATAGTGDVLTGIVAALLAGGLDPFDAASVGAHVHGVAGSMGPRPGTIASDVIAAVPRAIGRIRSAAVGGTGAVPRPARRT